MAEDTAHLVIEWMRRLDRKFDTLSEEMSHMKRHMTAMDRVLSGQFVYELDQNAELERLKSRVERIEKRMELSEG